MLYIMVMQTVEQPQTRVVQSVDIPPRTLQEELSAISATAERRFLLYRVAGASIEDALGYLHLKIGSYNGWLEKPAFQQLNARRKELELTHRAEAVKLLRRENQIGAVIIEEKIINNLLEELESKEYDLMKTPIAKTVYDKLMQDIDAMPTISLAVKQTFVDRMAVMIGGLSNGNGQAENSQPTQFKESQPYQITPTQGNNQVKESPTKERTVKPEHDVIVEGEIVDGQVVGVTFTAREEVNAQ